MVAGMVTEDEVRQALRNVLDPEIGKPIEDIGMLQGIEVNDGSVSGPAVRLARTRPFLAWNDPPLETLPLNDRLFDAFGLWPPLLMQA